MMAKKTNRMVARKTKKSRKPKEEEKKTNKKWIQEADIEKGAFTRKAKQKGITTAQLQSNVLKNPDEYDDKTVRQARLRQTLVGLKKRKDDQSNQEKKDA